MKLDKDRKSDFNDFSLEEDLSENEKSISIKRVIAFGQEAAPNVGCRPLLLKRYTCCFCCSPKERWQAKRFPSTCRSLLFGQADTRIALSFFVDVR